MKKSTKTKAIKGAQVLIKKCLNISTKDLFLLIYDETTRLFPSIFAEASSICGVKFKKIFVSTMVQSSREAFTTYLKNEISKAHGILVATTSEKSCDKFRIELTTSKRGARSTVATMPGACLEILTTTIDIDYEEVKQHCLELTLPFVKGNTGKIITCDKNGNKYELSFKLGGIERPPIQSNGIIPRLAWGNIPAGETFVAPLEDSAEGEFLVNGAIGAEKVIRDEALLIFRSGKLFDHFYLNSKKPVYYLEQIEKVAEKNDDIANWTTIAEIGIGVNKAIKRITGIPLVDEKKYGTLHIAIGHNVGYGGKNNCPSVHCDITTVNPSLIIDSEQIIDCGRHVYNIKKFQDDYNVCSSETQPTWDSNASSVKIHHNSYILSDNMLFAKKITSSGRQTIYPIGTSNTARVAKDLVTYSKGKNIISINTLNGKLKLNEKKFINLLAILRRNGIVSQ